MIDDVNQLNDADAKKLVQLLTKIMTTANSNIGSMFEVYVLARDARDLMVFDATSRDAMAKLTGSSEEMFQGYVVHADVVDHIKSYRKIDAIKQMRNHTGLGLKEAKDWVEDYARHKGFY